MKYMTILWQFARPHTIIGSWLSITALYFLSAAIIGQATATDYLIMHLKVYALTLGSALACNIYITGLNQWADHDLDLINKPWLPLPAGLLSRRQAIIIVLVCAFFALLLAAIAGWHLLWLIGLIMAIGTAYSLPPIQLKRHHTWAAFCILLVRGVLVNTCITAFFFQQMQGAWHIPADVWPLTLFITGFSIGIAWFKDIPDTTGDARFQLKTLPVMVSAPTAFRWGVGVVALSYIVLLLAPAVLHLAIHQTFYIIAHCLLLAVFLATASRVSVLHAKSIQRFYMRFWGFFFVEYLLYPASFYLLL